MAGLFGSTPAAATSTTGDTSKDVEIPQAELPSDSISAIQFNPAADLLAVSSWDGSVRIYEINNSGASGKWMFQVKEPTKASPMNPNPPANSTPESRPQLCVGWSSTGTRLASGGSQGVVNIADLTNGPAAGTLAFTAFNAHDLACKNVVWININNTDYLATGSWDKTVKMWDLANLNPENPQPLATLNVGERVYTMDVKKAGAKNLLVIGTAERHIHMVDLNSDPSKIFKTITSPLKWQTRVVSCFSDASGFAVGSIEGRCAIQYVDDNSQSSNFSFKCHRQQDPQNRDIAKVYSVNAISFHPQHGTFSTAGSDGTFHFWDKDAKHRLKGYPEVGGSITSTDFSRNGDIFAYAISYDWSRGYSANTPQQPTRIKLHPIVGDECKPRPGSKKR